MIDLSSLGTGLILQPSDARDWRAEPIFEGLGVNWSKGFYLPEPPNENQASSKSCVSHVWSYYHWQLTQEDYSRRSLYSRIYISPNGGAYLRDGGKEITTKGQATKDEAEDPFPQTEMEMRSREGITPEEEASDIEDAYLTFQTDSIDYYALSILYYQGVVFGVQGSWQAWQNLTNPTIPKANDAFWYHAIYGKGFHLHDGLKCIIAKSSWCGTQPGHFEHHIKEDYFASGKTYDNWVLIPKEKIMESNVVFVHRKNTAEYGFYLPGMSEEGLKDKAKNLGKNILKADGTIDFPKAKEIEL